MINLIFDQNAIFDENIPHNLSVVRPPGRNTNQTDAHRPEQPIDEHIAAFPFSKAMRAIIQFDRGENARRIRAAQDKIDMLLRYAIGAAELPALIGTGNDVRQSDLARDKAMWANDRGHDTKKAGLVPGEQESSGPKSTPCRSPAAPTTSR